MLLEMFLKTARKVNTLNVDYSPYGAANYTREWGHKK